MNLKKKSESPDEDYEDIDKDMEIQDNLTPDVDDLIRKTLDNKKIKNIDQTKKRAAVESVIDERTTFLLNKLLINRNIDRIEGIISSGKEANVYLAYDADEKEVALKIYKIDSNTSKWMRNYLYGDPRFKKIPKNISKTIFLWASKEFKNLKRANKSKLRVPKPIYVKNNILIMEYIGFGPIPAPKLKDIDAPKVKEETVYEIFKFIKDLYQKARLVHGDLSEFNILYHNQKPIIIDISQAVSIDHPKAEVYLVRDIKNVTRYFNKIGLKTPDPEDFYYEVIQAGYR